MLISGAGLPLVTTRLRIPTPRGHLAERRRLLARLDDILQRKLVLVSAPPGFGKTTFAAQWIVSAADRGWGIGWAALDGDGDPARFWAYFFAALDMVGPGLGGEAWSIIEAGRQPAEAALAVLVNAVAESPREYILVLDDYDLVETQAIHDQVAFLLEHLPPNLHLIMLSRVDPPLPLARLRLRGEMIELRAADLSFTLNEATSFFNDIMRLKLKPGDIAALEARTEGWAAGLQAAALSLQGRADVAGFIEAFAGSQRYVMDYLVEEVLNRQPAALQAFLLQTAVASRLCGSLCNALTGREDGQELLERLEGAGLFLVALDDERRWYRYHHLFADMLRHRLMLQPGGAGPWHCRACNWFQQNGMPVEAIEHAMAARDYELATSILEPAAAELVMREGLFSQVMGWLESFPAEVRRARPALGYWHAVAQFFHAGLGEPFEASLAEAERAWQEQDSEEGRGSTLSLRAHIAWRQRDYEQSRRLAEEALTLLPEDALFRRGLALHALGLAQYALGMVADAERTLLAARLAADKSGSRVGRWAVMAALAHVLAMQGRLREAVAGWQEVVDAGRGALLPAVIEARIRLADTQRELGNLPMADRLLRDGIAAAERAGLPELVVLGLLSLARTAGAQGDDVASFALFDWASEVAQGQRDQQLADEVSAHAIRRRLRAGDIAACQQWVADQGYQPDDQLAAARSASWLTYVRVLIAGGAAEEAQRVLRRVSQDAQRHGRAVEQLEVMILQALAHATAGRTDLAIRKLAEALAAGQGEGYTRLFLDEGPAVTSLLHSALSRNVAVPYVQRLLGAANGSSTAVPAASAALSRLVEPLSEREREVLTLIAQGASNQEIAEELTIALTTAKKHISNIIGKLGAGNRVQAVARARDLGLL